MSSPATTKATFQVKGMHCASCGILIDEVVEDVDGVATSATSVRRNRTAVTYDPTRTTTTDILTAIASAGDYVAELVEGPTP